MLGDSVGMGGKEWCFPWNMCQTTIDNNNGSNACVFITFNFGLLHKQLSLDNTLVGQSLDIYWQTSLEHAMRAGNEIHDDLFDVDVANATVQETIWLAGDLCHVLDKCIMNIMC